MSITSQRGWGRNEGRTRGTQGGEENGDMDAVGHKHVTEMWAGLGIRFLCAQNVAFGDHNLRKGSTGLPGAWRTSQDHLLQDLNVPLQRQLCLPAQPQGQLSLPLTLRIEDDVS